MNERQSLMKEFLAAMYVHAPPETRVVGCQFRGDPNADIPGKWRSRPVNNVHALDDGANVYLAVSAMGRNERGEYRRRKENFAAGLLLMIDDIGTGPGSKFPMSILDAATPTALVETSPANHQAVYMFSEAVTDSARFDALINGFIARQFLGRDTGMAGINRVFRPPYGINGKAKYDRWAVRCVDWNPDTRYSIEELSEAFAVDLSGQRPTIVGHRATVGRAEGIRAFVAVRQALRDAGMLKKGEPDMAGWQDVVCPWTGNHTGGVNNGAAIREPAEENLWCGAFRCHHGSCEAHGWSDLTQWLVEHQSDVLNSINERAGLFSDWGGSQ
jgi:hypothetical protein